MFLLRAKSPCGTIIDKQIDADAKYDLQETIKGSQIPLSLWTDTGLSVKPSTTHGATTPSGSTLYANVGSVSTVTAFAVDETVYFYRDSVGVGTYVRAKITAITENGASSYLTVVTLESGTSSELDNFDRLREYHAFPFPYNRDEAKYLYLHTTNQIQLSTNDVTGGSPDDNFTLPAGEYIIYTPDDAYNQTDPFSSADVSHLYVENGNGIGTDAVLTLILGTNHKRD